MDIKQSSLKPWLDPNETTGGQLNGLTAFGCDLHMKDCGGSGDGSGDVAWEPNGQCDTGQGWQNIWESPDLWNCAASGDLVSAATDPQIDANNFIGFQVRNESNCTSQPALLRLYWTMASTGEVWPDDWVDDSFTVGSTTCELGNEITTQPISIPPITSGSSHTGWQAWNPVNYVSPTANSPYISPSLCGVEPEIPSEGEPPQYEVCFLARLYSLEDPITGELEGESILDNVLASNNIVTRNVFLVEPSIIPPSPTDTNNGHPSGILVNNNNLYSANLNINFSEISAITDQYQDNILVEMFLSNDLWTKWASTGRNGQGISVDEINKIVEINDFETAKLLNIPFNAKEFQPIAVKVTLLSGAGKQAPTAEAEDFVFRISHEVVSHTGSVAPKSPSSCIFKVEDIGGRLEKIASSPSLQLYPNPARDLIYLHYNVEAETNNDLQIAIYTMDGKLLEIVPTPTPTNSNQHLSIPIAHLTTGCYIVHIKDGDKQFSEKFVKIQ
ncbi:MAG: T9SS type A sorting domain-containing protein [Chitinophagales bacterium]